MQLDLDPRQHRQRHLIGVSGGRDSVALIHELHRLGWKKLIVCHLNHQLRGRASNDDERFVRRLSARLGYVCESTRVDVRSRAEAQRQSEEVCGRISRHEFFAAMAKKHRCSRILLAHHADDQAETVLMRILRGTGISGLAGMSRESRLVVGGRALTLVRPMLNVRRAEIDAYVKQHRLRFREDASNATTETTRNRVRLQLLPVAGQALHRDIVPMLVRLSATARREDDFLSQATTLLMESAQLIQPDGRLCLKPELRSSHPALQHRVLQHWLEQLKVESLSAGLIDQAVKLMHEREPAKINLPGDRWLRRKKGCLWIESRQP